MPSDERSAYPIFAIIILAIFAIGCVSIVISSNGCHTDITTNRVVGVWESIDDDYDRIVFESNNQGHINTSLFFIWKLESKSDNKLYYSLDFSEIGAIHMCYLDAKNVNMMHYNGQVYIKRG